MFYDSLNWALVKFDFDFDFEVRGQDFYLAPTTAAL